MTRTGSRGLQRSLARNSIRTRQLLRRPRSSPSTNWRCGARSSSRRILLCSNSSLRGARRATKQSSIGVRGSGLLRFARNDVYNPHNRADLFTPDFSTPAHCSQNMRYSNSHSGNPAKSSISVHLALIVPRNVNRTVINKSQVRHGKTFSVQLITIVRLLRLRRLDGAQLIDHFANPLRAGLLKLLVGQLHGVEPDRRSNVRSASWRTRRQPHQRPSSKRSPARSRACAFLLSTPRNGRPSRPPTHQGYGPRARAA